MLHGAFSQGGAPSVSVFSDPSGGLKPTQGVPVLFPHDISFAIAHDELHATAVVNNGCGEPIRGSMSLVQAWQPQYVFPGST